jgi:cell division initiation protein
VALTVSMRGENMITPLDIQNKEFSKALWGYKEEDVDRFLDVLILDLEKLLGNNQEMKEQIKALSTEVVRCRDLENAVLETLKAAKSLMGDISASAEKRAEILLKNAELDAQLIQGKARESIEQMNEELVFAKTRLNVFRARYKGLLESELERFDVLSAELFADQSIEEPYPAEAAAEAEHEPSLLEEAAATLE